MEPSVPPSCSHTWSCSAASRPCPDSAADTYDSRVVVSRSHKGEVYKLVERFDPPGVITAAGGSGYKVGRRHSLEYPQIWDVAIGLEDVYVHSSMIKKVNQTQTS